MGLETATYVSELVATNPVSGDNIGQGDDHLRLIKAVLQNTLPNASRAFRFPAYEAMSTNQTLDATDDRKTLAVSASAGAPTITITLPAGLVTADNGFFVSVMRTDTDMTKRLAVVPASGTIDGLASIGIWRRLRPVGFLWTGSAWVTTGRDEAGVAVSFDGATAPPGSLFCYGQAISRTTYAELFAAISTTHGVGDGSTTFNLPDRRGRVDAGQDDMGGSSANRLTSPLNGDTLGAVGGEESHALSTAELAAHTHSDGSLVVASHEHLLIANQAVAVGSPTIGAGTFVPKEDSAGYGYSLPGVATAATLGRSSAVAPDVTGATGSAGSGTAHNNVQPTLVTNRIIWLG